MQPADLLKWYLEMGVDETVMPDPFNHFAAPPPIATFQEEADIMARKAQPRADQATDAHPPGVSLASPAPSAAMAEAKKLADAAQTRDQLKQAVLAFEGCALKKLATNTVFSDGNPESSIMLIGEAPGAQEDQQGIPFCGPSGQLLDKMFATIGLTRQNIYISNTIFWRPPGNRQPSKEELAICQPFVEKHIALINPKLLVLCGGTAVGAMLRRDIGISKLRGKFHEYSNSYMDKPVPTAVIFHPSYLLRSPGQKRLAWHDLLRIRQHLEESGSFPPA